jgi:hypothetical protein
MRFADPDITESCIEKRPTVFVNCKAFFYASAHSISGGRLRNKSQSKKYVIHISNPSHTFLTVTALTSLRSGCNILYTVEGVTPDNRANSVSICYSARNLQS